MTDTNIIFNLEFEYHYGQSWPELQFTDTVIDVQYCSVNQYSQLVTYSIQVAGSNLQFKNINKKETDTIVENDQIVRDQIVRLKKIWVEDILLDSALMLSHCEFIPDYHNGYLDYCKKNQITVEQKISTYDLYFNGLFTLNFKLPFWNWYALIKKQRNQKYFTSGQIELYIGNQSDKHKELLQRLKNLLNYV
jgi:hypothetical protein